MYLIAEEAWEAANPLVNELPGISGRLFSCVEVDLNVPLWHLELLVSLESGMECWRRFVLTSLEQAVATAVEYPGRSQLHYQSACSFKADRGYVLWPVKKVLAGCYADGLPGHMLVFPHGHEIYPHRRVPGTEFTSTSCLYEAMNFAASSAAEQSF